MGTAMECRVGCGACCIASSISSPIPGMPNGKPAGVRCIHLDEANIVNCMVRRKDLLCVSAFVSKEMCGQSAKEAFDYLTKLEKLTAV